MRRSICGAAGLVAVGLLTMTAAPSHAAGAEKSLLGITVWNRWADVLRKHGQPTRIEIGAVTASAPGGGGGAASMSSGGPMGMMGSGGGGPMGAPSAAGMSGGGRMGGMMGGPSSASYGAMMSAMNSQMGSRSGMSGGLPGMGGMGMMGSGSGGGTEMGGGGPMGMSSMGGGMGASAPQGDGSEGEVTWVYERGPLTNMFLFNKDGRVIQIQSFGYKGGGITAQGLKLGDPVSKIYGKYGWTSNVIKDDQKGTMVLDYSKDHQVAFQLADLKDGKKYRVVGITVGITDRSQVPGLGSSMGFGSASGGAMGGGMMGGGMPGGSRGGGAGLPGGRGGGSGRGGGASVAN